MAASVMGTTGWANGGFSSGAFLRGLFFGGFSLGAFLWGLFFGD